VVIGVILVMVSGVAMVTLAVDGGVPEFTAAAILFGVGAALVLDEFALVLHLSDVYWAEDGRTSVDAVFVAVAVAGLLVLGFSPLSFFDVDIWRSDDSLEARTTVVVVAVLTLTLAVIVLLKGKVWTGLVGMFITPLLFIAAFRLSRPHAPWARWRYTNRPRKMQRALKRERRLRRPVVAAKLWLHDAIAGMPKFPEDAKVDQQLDREIHPAPAPSDRDHARQEVT
jgi:ABC-type multidrug transport system fused ATPase/permease subunit